MAVTTFIGWRVRTDHRLAPALPTGRPSGADLTNQVHSPRVAEGVNALAIEACCWSAAMGTTGSLLLTGNRWARS